MNFFVKNQSRDVPQTTIIDCELLLVKNQSLDMLQKTVIDSVFLLLKKAAKINIRLATPPGGPYKELISPTCLAA